PALAAFARLTATLALVAPWRWLAGRRRCRRRLGGRRTRRRLRRVGADADGAVLTAAAAVTAIAAAAAATAAPAGLRLGRDGLIERRKHLGRRTEPQRRVRNARRVGALRDLDLDVRRHAGPELQLRVRHVDHRAVGRDVLDDDRLQADLRDRAFEGVARVGVDAEGDVQA